jgi:hypothetical protein
MLECIYYYSGRVDGMVIKKLIHLRQDRVLKMRNRRDLGVMSAVMHFASLGYIELAAAVDFEQSP